MTNQRYESFDIEAEANVVGEGHVSVTLDVRHLPSVKLLLVELGALLDDMRVGASPFVDRLENALDRFEVGDEGAA